MAWKSKWLQNFIFPKNALLIAHDSFDLNSKLSIVNKMYIWSIFWNPLTKRESLDALNKSKGYMCKSECNAFSLPNICEGLCFTYKREWLLFLAC